VNTIILRASTRLVMTLLLLFAVFLLLRGHNEPGGGFVGGLMAAAGFALYSASEGPAAARRALYVDPRTLIAVGLLVAVSAGVISLLLGDAFLTSHWGKVEVLGLPAIDVGTPLLFDLGVFIVVLGVVQTIILTLWEE